MARPSGRRELLIQPTHPATIRDALQGARLVIDRGDPAEARVVAELLLAAALGLSRAGLYARLTEPLLAEAAGRFAELVERYRTGEPAAYLVGHRAFHGIDLLVSPDVLIPRPETELLVDRAIACIRAERAAGHAPRAADIGTGSGAIAIAMARAVPDLRLWATDLSPAALTIARKNARRVGVADRIEFLAGDLTAPLPEPVEILIANLPYVPSPGGRIAAETTGWEPDLALDGGPDGLRVIDRFLRLAADRVVRPGWILLEVGTEQAARVIDIAEQWLGPIRADTIQDAGHLDRVVVVQCPRD